MRVTAQAENKKFHPYPTRQVIAVINEPGDAAAARVALEHAGFAGAIEVLAGAEGLRRLDATGARHGVAGRLLRIFQGYGDMENQIFLRQAEELRAGYSLVGVRAVGAAQRRSAELIFKRHHGRFINYFGLWTITGMAA